MPLLPRKLEVIGMNHKFLAISNLLAGLGFLILGIWLLFTEEDVFPMNLIILIFWVSSWAAISVSLGHWKEADR